MFTFRDQLLENTVDFGCLFCCFMSLSESSQILKQQQLMIQPVGSCTDKSLCGESKATQNILPAPPAIMGRGRARFA